MWPFKKNVEEKVVGEIIKDLKPYKLTLRVWYMDRLVQYSIFGSESEEKRAEIKEQLREEIANESSYLVFGNCGFNKLSIRSWEIKEWLNAEAKEATGNTKTD